MGCAERRICVGAPARLIWRAAGPDLARRTTETLGMVSYEKLDVYQRSIELLAAALRIAEKLPRGQAPLADQFRRAAMSIPLNVAEGSGRSPGVRRPKWHQAKALLVRVVEMLSKMC